MRDVEASIETRVTIARARARALEMNDGPTYFYIDPHGREQGPFAFADVLKWFRAGYLSPTLGCRRSDETAYARTVTDAVLADAAMHGVALSALGTRTRGSDGARGREGAASGTSGLVSVPPPPPPPAGRSEDEIAQCMERLMEVLDRVLPIVLEGGLREEFGPVWEDMLRTPPPWTLETTLRELKANWGSLFSTQPRRANEIQTLLDAAIRQRKNLAIATGSQSKDVSNAAVCLLGACPKTFPPAVIEELRIAWEECEKIRAYLN